MGGLQDNCLSMHGNLRENDGKRIAFFGELEKRKQIVVLGSKIPRAGEQSQSSRNQLIKIR